MQSSDSETSVAEGRSSSGPSVSVVIPSYNCASFLQSTLESVLKQTYTDLEVILVDDGSTDETAAVVAPYLDRVRYIRQENRGLSGARNTGIKAARGRFIALLDADDSWVERKLEQQMPRFVDPEVGMVYSDFSVLYLDGTFQESYLVNRPLASEGWVIESYIRSRFLFPSTMVFRRRCFQQVGLFDEEMLACEDIDLFSRMCLRWKVALVNAPLMVRFEGGHNITSNTRRMSEYTILALEKLLKKEPGLQPSVTSVVRRELAQQHWWAGYSAFEENDFARARPHLRRSVRYDPRRWRACLTTLLATYVPRFVIGAMRARKRA